MRKISLLVLLFITCFVLSGCGETIAGAGKDISRVGRGVSTVFFRQ